MNNVERTILRNLLENESYARKVIPFLKPDYFEERKDRVLVDEYLKFIEEFNTIPTNEALVIKVEGSNNLSDDEYKDLCQVVSDLRDSKEEPPDEAWLLKETEQFCQDRAIHAAIMESISILDGSSKKLDKGAIPGILSEALGVSFDTHIGHDFLGDAEERYDFYHEKVEKIPFDIEMLNKITKGGFEKKTLNLFIAPTGLGKSLIMCHLAASYLSQGRNVLYITLEMSEKKIAERIDANLLDITMDDLHDLSKEMYMTRIGRVQKKTEGKLIVKEYPTASAHVGHFRHLVGDLRLKKKFIPEIIIVDYMNICTSSKLRLSNSVNSYTLVKSIAEELRGFAVELNLPIISATQTNRSGFDDSDLTMSATSESAGTPMTVDFLCAVMQDEKLEALKQYLFKQLKNRYSDINIHKRFIVGVDKSKMRIFNASPEAQENVMGIAPDEESSAPAMDPLTEGAWEARKKELDFTGFKV